MQPGMSQDKPEPELSGPPLRIENMMAAYQRGDQVAAARLIGSLSPQLHRFFMVHVRSREYADDLLQETWLRIHKVRHTYRPGEPLLPWLYAVARNVRVDQYRKLRRVESREYQVDELPQVAAAPIHSAADGEGFATLLNTLPASQREVLTLLKVSGMSLEEVARATSSSVGSVKQKAHRAYEKLRGLLARPGMKQTAAGASDDL